MNYNMELHLFIIWAKGRYKEKEIIDDIAKNFSIIESYKITWSPEFVSSNFTRFYGVNLPPQSAKEQECGIGEFILLTVVDHKPKYEFILTSKGYKYINSNMFYAKERYRGWTNGGHKIHATNTPEETKHDLFLLLGEAYDDYLNKNHLPWNDNCKSIKRDLPGAGTWKNLAELFETLNYTTEYVVLRNFENLPAIYDTGLHSDIDILVKNKNDAAFLLNSVKSEPGKNRVRYSTTVNGEKIYFDIRHTGDGYYCKKWQEHLLIKRKKNKHNLYTPCNEDYFYTLIYHALMHKKEIAADYYTKLANLAKTLDLDLSSEFDNGDSFDKHFTLLLEHMDSNGYFFTEPNDKSVFYNKSYSYIPKIISALKNDLPLTEIRPYKLETPGGSGSIYFTGIIDDKKIFIKWGGFPGVCKNEFVYTNTLYKQNNKLFLKPLFYDKINNKYAGYEYTPGVSLRYIIDNVELSEKQQTNFIIQLRDIYTTMKELNVSHRDIRPENFIVHNEYDLFLIDMQFMVNNDKYKEFIFLCQHTEIAKHLGDKYAYAKFKWDDAFSLAKILKEIGYCKSNEKLYKSVEQFILKEIGINTIYFPRYTIYSIPKRIIKFISCITPVKSWRKKIRQLYEIKTHQAVMPAPASR